MKKYFISALFLFGLAVNAILQKDVNSSSQINTTIDNKTAINYQNSSDNSTQNNTNTSNANINSAQDINSQTILTDNTNQASSPVPTPTPSVQSIPSIQVPPPVVPVSNGKYKNGTYTGLVADASYGNVQVQAIIDNGKLSDVVVLQYPNDRQHSIQVANYSLPKLKQEAISTQSANINSISGASFTSEAYRQSLSDALSQALN